VLPEGCGDFADEVDGGDAGRDPRPLRARIETIPQTRAVRPAVVGRVAAGVPTHVIQTVDSPQCPGQARGEGAGCGGQQGDGDAACQPQRVGSRRRERWPVAVGVQVVDEVRS